MGDSKDAFNQEMKILIVDGVQEVLDSLSALVLELGFSDVQTTSSGTKALELVEQGEVELVITDWSVPELDGLDILKAIRANSEISSLPVLMTACEQESENLLEAICEGVSSFLVLSEDQAEDKNSLKLRLESVLNIDRHLQD